MMTSSLYFGESVKYTTSISKSAVFLRAVLDLLKQSRLDFSNPKQTFV